MGIFDFNFSENMFLTLQQADYLYTMFERVLNFALKYGAPIRNGQYTYSKRNSFGFKC